MNFIEILPLLFINLQSLYKKKLNLIDLTFPQLIGLYVIPDDGIDISTLAIRIGNDISTLSRLINGLEKKNLVERNKKISLDKRVITVCLSSKGIEVKKELENQFDKINLLLEAQLDSKNINFNEEILSKLNWEISKILFIK